MDEVGNIVNVNKNGEVKWEIEGLKILNGQYLIVKKKPKMHARNYQNILKK